MGGVYSGVEVEVDVEAEQRVRQVHYFFRGSEIEVEVEAELGNIYCVKKSHLMQCFLVNISQLR